MTDKDVQERYQELDNRAKVIFDKVEQKPLFFCVFIDKDGKVRLTRPSTDFDLALAYGRLVEDASGHENTTPLVFYKASEGVLQWRSFEYVSESSRKSFTGEGK